MFVLSKPSLTFVAIFALPTLLAACGKEYKADVGCPDISGEWTADGLVGEGYVSITQSGCDSITGPLVSDDAQTISTNSRDIGGKTVRAEFSKDAIVIVREQTVPSGLGTDDQAGKTSIMRATITKVSNDELNIVINVEGPDLFRTLFDQRPDKNTVLRRAKADAVPAASDSSSPSVDESPDRFANSQAELAELFKQTQELKKALKGGGTSVKSLEDTLGKVDDAFKALQESAPKAKPKETPETPEGKK